MYNNFHNIVHSTYSPQTPKNFPRTFHLRKSEIPESDRFYDSYFTIERLMSNKSL